MRRRTNLQADRPKTEIRARQMLACGRPGALFGLVAQLLACSLGAHTGLLPPQMAEFSLGFLEP